MSKAGRHGSARSRDVWCVFELTPSRSEPHSSSDFFTDVYIRKIRDTPAINASVSMIALAAALGYWRTEISS